MQLVGIRMSANAIRNMSRKAEKFLREHTIDGALLIQSTVRAVAPTIVGNPNNG